MEHLDVKQILNVFNYFDGAVIADETGAIVYYSNQRNHRDDWTPNAAETSSLHQVLKTGKPIYNHTERLSSTGGRVEINTYSTLPIVRNDKVVGAVKLFRCVNAGTDGGEVTLCRTETESPLYCLSDIVTTSSRMKAVKQQVLAVASMDSPVMICGETGTGKEMVAQSIHTASSRAQGPFLSQNCAAIPSTLLESLLFGTVRGAYTGAEDRPGLFEMADGGTLFLDEINSMEPAMQAKLLQVIESGSVTRLGDHRSCTYDVRILSAANEEPHRCVMEKKLREDLFYRLSALQIHIPPLRERVADIGYLTEHFIAVNNSKMNKNVLGVSPEVFKRFEQYNWPGNVRELKNIVEGAFNILGDGRFIREEHLPQYVRQRMKKAEEAAVSDQGRSDDFRGLKERVEEYEKQLIQSALRSTENVQQAAQLLRISKQGMYYKMEKYGLSSQKRGRNTP